MIDDGGVASGSWGPGGVPCPAAILFGSTPASQPQILKLGDNKSDANISAVCFFFTVLTTFIDRLFRCAVARSLSKTTGRRWRQIVGINSWKTPEKTRPEMLMEGVGTDALGRWLHPTPFVPRRFTCSPWNHPLPPGLLPPPLPHHLVALSSFLFLS